MLIAKGTGNRLMVNLVEALSDVIQTGVRAFYEQTDLLNVEETYQRHADLYEAVCSRDADVARAAMREHFRSIEVKVFMMERRERSSCEPKPNQTST